MGFDNFFHSVLEFVPDNIERIVVVTHLVPGVDDFLLCLNSKIKIAAVIPKPNSINQEVLRNVASMVPVLRYTRDQIKTQRNEFLRVLSGYVEGYSFAIIDTGGYFSHVLFDLVSKPNLRLIGIVEDTENGHQKYESLFLNKNCLHHIYPCPILSVARSPLKDPEDFLVGQAVVFSADALLREVGKILIGRRALVIGYGKIGRSIASNLRSKSMRVGVLDNDPVRQALALAHGYYTASRTELFENADIFFCATGNKSLVESDFSIMKKGAFIFTATSGDDEIAEYDEILRKSTPSSNPKISIIDEGGKGIYLCNDGNSANFMHGGVVGPFIKLVQAELLFALSQLHKGSCNEIGHLDDDLKKMIANLWLDEFHSS